MMPLRGSLPAQNPGGQHAGLLRDLAESDIARWQVLCRADRGGLSLHGDLVVDEGRALPSYLNPTSHGLINNGLLSVAPRHVPNGRTSVRVELTDAGRAELARLTSERQHSIQRNVRSSSVSTDLCHRLKESTMWEWILVILCALVFVIRIGYLLFDRPSPFGTDAQQRERARK
ncbi:hypothetical protein [Amycolatopsis pithecellobii]|uniref:Uncharacterized protein n=1 Tax=Amycolatopsis pithecellobii TaxID=664692 RepID=A0A6N7YVP4_9PSEU|nr:hypothetical protein [Amycolatopsis pithecellobii]MTD57147.1 hypothetical protein [Amycolatopsis pithecellobii]